MGTSDLSIAQPPSRSSTQASTGWPNWRGHTVRGKHASLSTWQDVPRLAQRNSTVLITPESKRTVDRILSWGPKYGDNLTSFSTIQQGNQTRSASRVLHRWKVFNGNVQSTRHGPCLRTETLSKFPPKCPIYLGNSKAARTWVQFRIEKFEIEGFSCKIIGTVHYRATNTSGYWLF